MRRCSNARAGAFLVGDARTLEQTTGGWRVGGSDGTVVGRETVVALGPWSDLVFGPLGYSIPLGVSADTICIWRRAAMPCSIIRSRFGSRLFAGAMNRGIRLTPASNLPARSASDLHPDRAGLARAQALFPLGDASMQALMGARPCLPDMLPVIGRPRHAGCGSNFGHQHMA